MDKTGVIWRKELSTALLSPFLYAAGAIYLAMTGLNFWKQCAESAGGGVAMSALLFGSLFFWMLTLAWVTVLTMRTFPEEARSGTLDLLLAAPIEEAELVLGKFAAAWSLFVLFTLPLAAYPWLLKLATDGAWAVDRGQVWAGMAGLWWMGAFFTAAGVLIATLSSGPVPAAMATFAFLCLAFFGEVFWLMGGGAAPRWWGSVSVVQQAGDFARGVVDSRAVVAHGTGAALALFLAVKVLQARRLR